MFINYTDKEAELLARTMRAEALNEGELGMLMVGNVIANRVVANCYIFKNTRTISDVIYQKNQFSGINSPLFQAKPTALEKRLAERILRGEDYYPATHALWFYAPQNSEENCIPNWYNQNLAGKYKSHCFYKPNPGECQEIY